MPSGFHGGGGGSHSGGFGGGGSHFGHGRSTGSSARRHAPIRIWFFGHHYYVPVEKTSKIRAWFTAFVVLLIFGLVMTLAMTGEKSKIELIQTDHDYYVNMIERATLNPAYKKVARITNILKNPDCGKWYFTYVLTTDQGLPLEGYTYSVYTFKEIKQFVIDQEIEVAVNSTFVTASTDSINMDYINIPIENDGEYSKANTLKKVFTAIMIVLLCASAACLVLGVLKTKKEMQLNELEKEKSSCSVVDEGLKRCPYCGSKQNPGNAKCTNCGADSINQV